MSFWKMIVRRTAPLSLALLAACTTLPSGPSVMALPGSNRDFDQFRVDDANCRNYAAQAIGANSAEQAAIDSGVRSAAVGTLVGAAAGAAIDGSHGAGTGAGVGLLFGSLAGVASADASRYGTQRRYDLSYVQCMYARGHQVPASSAYTVRRTTGTTSVVPAGDYVAPAGSPPPPPDDTPPPPPAGNPPPPPPG